MKLRKRMDSRAGFTLMELLCAVLILAMIAWTVVTGVSIGAKTLDRNRYFAGSRSYEDLLRIALEDLLHYAEGTCEGGTAVFSCPGRGITEGVLELENGVLLCTDRITGESFPLPGPGLFPELELVGFSIAYEPDSGVFSGSFTLRGGGEQMERTAEFAIRTACRPG